jgi:methionine-rich copper-binding protein CopC
MMKATLPHLRPLLLALLLLTPGGFTFAATTSFHFALTKSVPADEATVRAVPEVKLWFSEVPEDGTVSMHLLDEGGDAVQTTSVAQDPEDPTAFFIRPSNPPPAARYSVAWRGMGDDGHVVRGTLKFNVTGH